MEGDSHVCACHGALKERRNDTESDTCHFKGSTKSASPKILPSRISYAYQVMAPIYTTHRASNLIHCKFCLQSNALRITLDFILYKKIKHVYAIIRNRFEHEWNDFTVFCFLKSTFMVYLYWKIREQLMTKVKVKSKSFIKPSACNK